MLCMVVGCGLLFTQSTPVAEPMEYNEAMTLCPGRVSILISEPVNCVSTAFAYSRNATGADWTIQGGVILSGQGTQTITFIANNLMGNPVTLTARAHNLPCYSQNTASRTVTIGCF